MIRPAKNSDAEAIAAIYNWYIKNSIISFEEESLAVSAMADRIARADDNNPWLLLEVDSEVLAYAYATPWNSREAYRYTKESSVYVHHDHCGLGYGQRVMESLIDEIRKAPIHVLIAAIALPNPVSIGLHEKLAFEKIGKFKEVGLKFSKKIDVGYWQLML